MDLDDVYHITIAVAIVAWAVFFLGLVGELLGWWNETGELLMAVGAITGVPVSLAGLVWGAGRHQVGRIADVVVQNNSILQHHTGFFVSMDAKLDKLDQLDTIQLQLDRQTGVLEEQLHVLRRLGDGT